SDDMPARFHQDPAYCSIPLAITRNLRDPIASVVTPKQIPFQPWPVPAVPEVPVTENHHPGCTKDKIRTARQVVGIFPVSEAQHREFAAKKHLMQCMLLAVRTLRPRCRFRSWLKPAETRVLGYRHIGIIAFSESCVPRAFLPDGQSVSPG